MTNIKSNFKVTEEADEPRPKRSKAGKSNFDIYPDEIIPSSNTNEMETIEYTVIDDTNINKKNTFVEITTSLEKTQEKIKKRSKGLGKFVASLTSSITDDKLFISTQRELLNVIYNAQMKQLQLT